MTTPKLIVSALLSIWAILPCQSQRSWTLEECIAYAMDNSIQLKKGFLSSEQASVNIKEMKAGLLPSLSANSNHNVSYRPFNEQMVNITNGTMTTSHAETNYNGSYGLNASWTVWNGWRNRDNIQKSEYALEMTNLQNEETANSIQEQIAQLYVQILYESEAVKVSQEIVNASEIQRNRAAEMVKVGSLARVDLIQLEAQLTQDQYSLVSAQSQLQKFELQLKQLLEIHNDQPFSVVIPQIDDSHVMTLLPSMNDVYQSAVASRPEIARIDKSIESAQLDIKMAKNAYLPTLSLNAGIGTSSSSGVHRAWPRQFKNNFNNTLGMTISVPIFDNRSIKSNVERSRIALQDTELDLVDKKKQLYSDIENYWLNARTAQQQYLAASKNVESMKESYDLVSEQFRLGLKNIVELTTGKNNLLSAQQQKLQAKYTALLNLALLRFYQGEDIHL